MQQKQIRILFAIIGITILSVNFYQIYQYSEKYTQLVEVSDEIPFQKGVSFTSWASFTYNTTDTKAELDALKENGIEWACINNWWFQDYLNSTDIHMGPWSDGYENMTACFQYAKSIGLHILYKPMLNLEKVYDWRPYIVFTEEWMLNYTAWMVNHAIAAEAGGVEILSIGCEMGNMQVHSEDVREMIRQVREVYSGLLTYSANHDSFKHIDWWDAVDIIGTSMYSMMTVDWDPTVEELTTVWDGFYNELEELALRWNKPILFTEIGIQALDGSNLIPNDNQISREFDLSEMENYYLSLFNSKIWSAPWFKGAYWWIWDGGYDSHGFNPYLVRDILHEEYSGVHHVETTNPKLIQALVTLSICALGFVILLAKSKQFIIMQDADRTIRRVENITATESPPIDPTGEPEDTTQSRIIGLLLGSFLYIISTNIIKIIHGVIQKSFSYAIILQKSTTEITLTFVGLIISSLILGFIILRFGSQWSLSATYFLILGSTFLSLSSNSNILFVQTFLEITILFSIVVNVIFFTQKQKERQNVDLFLIVKYATGTFAICMVAFLLLSTFTLGLVSLPIGLSIILIKEPYIWPTNSEEKDSSTVHQKPYEIIALFNSFIAGMIIPFGNSILNLVSLSLLTVTYHFLPAAISASIFLLVFGLVMQKKQQVSPHFREGIFSNRNLLVINLIMGLFGIIYILLSNFTPLWFVISGIYLVLYIGTLINSIMKSAADNKAGRRYLFITALGFCFALGFMVNAIKGLLIYLITFLVIKDGAITRRNPAVDPVTNLNVPAILNGFVIAIELLLTLLMWTYFKIRDKKKPSSK